MPLPANMSGLIFAVFVVVFILYSAIKILREYERGVVFRLGRVALVLSTALYRLRELSTQLPAITMAKAPKPRLTLSMMSRTLACPDTLPARLADPMTAI